jgi:predicted amidohydrolase YtcJ
MPTGRTALLAGMATAAALVAAGAREANGPAADRVFLNGRIWTGETEQPWAEALAVRGTRLIAVGKTKDVEDLAGKGTDVVDLHGRFVAPGFIDAHLHLEDGGASLEELRLDEAGTFADIRKAVSEWAAAHPDRHWVTGEGWQYEAFPGALPTRLQLDAIVSDRPAWLVSYDGHTGWANSLALRLAGVTLTTLDPPGGTIGRDTKGEPSGVLKETAMDLVARLVPKLLPHEKERALKAAIEQAAAWGLTSVHQAGMDEEDLRVLADAVRDVPKLRVYVALPIQRNPAPAALAHQDELRRRYADGLVRVGAIKGYVDGVVESGTAAMFDPYPTGGRGIPRWTQAELDRTVAAYDAASWQVMLHAIGDRAIDMALAAFEHAARTNHTSGRRHRVEHIEVPRLSDLPRFRAGGIIASTQALFAYPGPKPEETVYIKALGPERARRAMPFKSIDDAGAAQAFGSDWPVFSAEVARGIGCAVTRTTAEGLPVGGWNPEQRLSPEAALSHFTRDAAFAEHAETEKGSLAPGKLADFVVLSKDILDAPPGRIRDTKVLLTVLGGQDTWRAPDF